ncbi:MAG: hypothetical protein ACLP8S_00945 [Solirubrobacteraceae bacterium]
MLYALDRELLDGDCDCPGPLTDADARFLLPDELHRTGSVQQNAIQQGVTVDD